MSSRLVVTPCSLSAQRRGRGATGRGAPCQSHHGKTDFLFSNLMSRLTKRPVTCDSCPQAACDHDRACGRGFSCDRHFGLCVPLRGEGYYCRRDAQCVRGLSCMFGKCHRSVPNGQEDTTFFFPPGARCKLDRDCGASMCCARHHGERVCKRRLMRGDGCYVPDGGLAFSINQICPCDEGLLCRENVAPRGREDFIYQAERTNWTCQVPER
uniref:Dickkopf-related protein 3-like n=1 Tax=Hippocampus comes TaxID=109280 RepID=A0A3Q3DDE2_HIPCM